MQIKNDFRLDDKSKIPYYFQLKQYFLKIIENGEVKPGEMLPSESQVCNSLNISRIVVKQAFQELKSEGYIFSKKGKGTFLAKPKYDENWIQSFAGFNTDMEHLGYKVKNNILCQEIIITPEKVAKILDLKNDEEVILIKRVHIVNGVPVYLSNSFLLKNLFLGLLKEDLECIFLYKLLKEKYGIEIVHSKRYIDLGKANIEEAKELKIEKGEPVFKVEGISYIEGEIPFEFFTSTHIGGVSRFVVEFTKKE